MPTTATILHTESPDGTRIAHHVSGEGPPLVLVHGTTADHTRWAPVLPALERHFTVHALDRRGRGASGDGPAYALEREVEDVAAAVDGIGGPVDLVGHSFGAAVGLEAALLTRNVRRLVLYEGGAKRPGQSFAGLFARLASLLEAGDREGVVLGLMGEAVRPEEIEVLRSLPAWTARIAAAHTVPREIAAHDGYVFDPARFAHLAVPTLLLLGGESPEPEHEAARDIAAALRDATIAVMPGQGHAAMDTGTEVFTTEVLRFLRGTG